MINSFNVSDKNSGLIEEYNRKIEKKYNMLFGKSKVLDNVLDLFFNNKKYQVEVEAYITRQKMRQVQKKVLTKYKKLFGGKI